MASVKELILGKVDQAVIQQYISLVDHFIAKNTTNKDLLSIVLEYDKLLITLSELYNSDTSQFGSIPILNTKRMQLINFKHTLTENLLNAILSDEFGKMFLIGDANAARKAIACNGPDYTIPVTTSKMPLGINGYMLAAIRYYPDKDVSEEIKISLQKTEILDSAGSNVNASDEFGRTALFYIVTGPMITGVPQDPGREQMTRKLLECGANPNHKDQNGRTALDYFMLEHFPSKDAITLLRAKMNLPPINTVQANVFVREPDPNPSLARRLINYLKYPFLAIANLIKNLKAFNYRK